MILEKRKDEKKKEEKGRVTFSVHTSLKDISLHHE